MTKARTKAQKRAAKRGRLDLPELAPTKKRDRAGRFKTDRGDASTEPLKARCRQMGKSINRANLREMRAPWWGCYAGRVIGNTAMGDAERQELWNAIQAMRAITVAFDASVGAPRRHAACLRLLAPTDEFSADATTPPVDTRSDEDKARAAEARWMAMHGWLGWTDSAAASVAKRCVLDDLACVDADALLRALRCVADGLADRRMTYRGAG